MTIPYSELNSSLTPEQNAANMEIVAEIIKQNQLRSIGQTLTNDLITNEGTAHARHTGKRQNKRS